MTNCPNCGSVIDIAANKCAYCGTPYYDLSCIPLHKPFFLRLNVGTDEKPQIILQKVYTSDVTMTFSDDPVICRDGSKNIHISRRRNTEYELTFIGINEVTFEKGGGENEEMCL